jgi:hypothetical protein
VGFDLEAEFREEGDEVIVGLVFFVGKFGVLVDLGEGEKSVQLFV